MLSALVKAFARWSDPRLSRILKLGVAVALGCWLGLALIASVVLRNVRLFENSWADTGADAALGLVALVVPLLFFSAVATFVMSFWLDDVADIVEEKHYPDLGPARRIGWKEALLAALRFLLVMVTVTVVAAPVYLALLFFGLGIILNYAINGYLLGREYFELVASRRMEAEPARLLFRNNLGRLWLCGAAINLLFQIPLLNLTAPVTATAFMVHVFQGLRGKEGRV
jgi:CysZ protein